MNVLILNQFVPPDPAPTARLAGDVALLFRQHGHTVRLLGSSQHYRARGKWEPRIFRDGLAWFRVFLGALRDTRPDLVVAFSSPPCLLVAAALAARWHRARLVHWAMDLYPETAVALGALPTWAAAPLAGVMRWAYSTADKVVALDGDMKQRLAGWCRSEVAVVPPWPPEWPAPGASSADFPVPGSARVWLYSGNLGQAHVWRPLLAAQQSLEARGSAWWLVLQGGGAGWAEARREAGRLGLRQCVWLDYAADADAVTRLAAAAVLVATRHPALRGLLWPSKLAVALAWPQRIAWVGDTDSAVAKTVCAHPGSAVFARDDATGLADWLRGLPEDAPQAIDPQALERARLAGQTQWWREVMDVDEVSTIRQNCPNR